MLGVYATILSQTSPCRAGSESVLQLSPDSSFHFKLLVNLAMASNGGADINDILSAAKSIRPSDFSSWNNTFYDLAVKTQKRAEEMEMASGMAVAQSTYFSAANYWRNVDYYLHGDPTNGWINETWAHQKALYDKAMAAMPVPGQRLTLPSDGFDIYAIYYPYENPAVHVPATRPTIILNNGYDGSQEDIFFALGVPAHKLGYNVITFEGPGQPSVRRNQSVGFIKDWNKCLTPILDYLINNRSDVNVDKIIYVGFSFGGFLAEQAAIVENDRLAGLALDGGVYDVYQAFTNQLPTTLQSLFTSGNKAAFDTAVNSALKNESYPTQLRWGVQQGLWSFDIESPFDFLSHVHGWNVSGELKKITKPVWIANPSDDQFYEGQAMQVYNELKATNKHITLQNYTGAYGAHCQAGSYDLLAGNLFSWIDSILKIEK